MRLTNNDPEIGSLDTGNQKYTGNEATGEIKYTIGISYTTTDNSAIPSFKDDKNVSEITVHIVPQRYSSVVVTRNDNGTISLSIITASRMIQKMEFITMEIVNIY